MGLKKVAVVLDGSLKCLDAIDVVAPLLEASGSQLILLAVISEREGAKPAAIQGVSYLIATSTSTSPSEETPFRLKQKRWKMAAEEMFRPARRILWKNGLHAEFKVVGGDPVISISDFAIAEHIDLIVLRKMKRSPRLWPLRRTTYHNRLIEQCPRPVMSINEKSIQHLHQLTPFQTPS
ncbi:universal stress protein [Aureibacillus halotolerans]|uniref:Universal stress protein family protein n=1 Tax=Aureibacillus halotolerans TaxID=1508390 RepID=A0A4R6U5F0_9BACI|nr:universal stress protein [Aureibacillus halotolerans]TDQ41441.1 universal stress protein family protein [Aureibacillus halotolerans]